jgi:hypothetical protein
MANVREGNNSHRALRAYNLFHFPKSRLDGHRTPTYIPTTIYETNGRGGSSVWKSSHLKGLCVWFQMEAFRLGGNLHRLPQPVSGPFFCYHLGLLHHVVRTDLVSDCDCRAKSLVADKALDVVRTWPTTTRAAVPDRPEHMLAPRSPINYPSQQGSASGNGRGSYTTAVTPDTTDGRTREEAALLDQVRRVMDISPPESSPNTQASRAFLEGLAVGARLAGVSPAAATALPSSNRSRSPFRRVGPDAHRHRSRSRLRHDAHRHRSRSPLRRVGPDARRHHSPLRERERPTPPRTHHRPPRGPSNSDHWDDPPEARYRRVRLEPGRLTPPPRYDRSVRDYSDLYEPSDPGNSSEEEGMWLHDRYRPDESGRRSND